MATIAIEGMKFHAFHGCMEEEQVIGNTFVVDVYLEAETIKAEQSDDLKHTTDYAQAYEVVKKEMESPSKLLEHLGRRILDALKNTFPEITAAEIKVSKKNPPIHGEVESVSVTLFDDYDDATYEI
jgi:dihydroneopterin aldolase